MGKSKHKRLIMLAAERVSLKFFSALAIFFFIVISFGCQRGEKAKEISLEKSRETGEVSRTIEDKNTVYFGFDLRLKPREDARIYSSLLRYLSEKTGHTFKIRFTSEYETTQDNLGKGITHFAALGPVSFLKAKEKYGAKILVRGLNKENKAEYQAIIFTRPASDIQSLRDLKGRSFAFGSRDSTQGYLIPRKMLESAGLTLTDMKYEYTGSHSNAVEAVIEGLFDAGGCQDTLVRKMAKEGKVRILKESEYYPSSGIAANKHVDPRLIGAVKKALLELDPKGLHKNILVDWERTEMPNGFVEASEEDYRGIEEIMKKYGVLKP